MLHPNGVLRCVELLVRVERPGAQLAAMRHSEVIISRQCARKSGNARWSRQSP